MWLEKHETSEPLVTNNSIDRYDSLFGWTLKENFRNTDTGTTGWQVSSNSKGLRGITEYSYRKTGKLRILTIGDSFTFGECVSDGETFPAVLETLLDSTEVINLAVHGYGHDQQLLKLMDEGVKYHPDIVLLGYVDADVQRNKVCFRDYAKPYFILDSDTLKLQGVPVPSPAFFLNAFRWKSWGLIKAKWAALTERNNDPVNNNISKKILYKMQEQCKCMDARLVVVRLPYEDEASIIHLPIILSLIQLRQYPEYSALTRLQQFIRALPVTGIRKKILIAITRLRLTG